MTTSSNRSADARPHLTQVARGGAINLIGAAVSAVSGFALVLLVTNLYSAGTAGALFASTSALLVLTAVASLGSETGLARFLLRFESIGRSADIQAVVRIAIRPPMVLSVVLGAALVVVADPVAVQLGIDDKGGAATLRILALTLPFVTLNSLSLAGTRAFGRMRTTAIVDGIGRSAGQPLGVALAALIGGGLVVMTAFWALPYVVAALVSAYLFHQQMGRRTRRYEASTATDYRQLRREYWAFTWPRSITRISQMVIQRADIVLVAILLGPSDAAIYTAATRFVALGQVAAQAIQQVLQPKFTELLAGDDQHVLDHVFRTAAAWSMALAWPLYVVVGCLPAAYLGLFGPGYADSGVLVVILMSAAMMFGVASGAADTLLLMSGRSILTLANSLTALVIDIGLCLALIPAWGIVGAAAAWALAVVVRCSLALVQARITLGVLSFGGAAGRVAIATLVCLVVPLTASQLFLDAGPVGLLVIIVVALTVYAATLWHWRDPLELSVLRGALVRRRRPAELMEAPRAT